MINFPMKNEICDYTLKTNFNKIEIREYIDNYYDRVKFHELCKKCDKYGTLWSCPPYSFNAEDYIKNYKYAYIIGTKIILDNKLIRETKKEDVIDCTYKILNEVRKRLEKMLLELENKHPNSISLYAGSCLNCNVCTRTVNKPCIQPETMRYSLESLGFDVSKTASKLLNIELKWAEDSLPEYFTLVNAFFTNTEIED